MDSSYSIDTINLVGKSNKGRWSGIVVTPPKGENVKKFGQLFVSINLEAPDEFSSKVAGDLLGETVQDTYYESKEKNVINRLEKAMMAAAKRLEFLLQREKIAAERGIDLNIIVVVIRKEFIYMAVLGEGNIMLYRDDRLISLSEGLKDLTGRSLIRSGSGEWKIGDKFILVSSKASIGLSEKELKKSMDNLNFDNVKKDGVESLSSILVLFIKSEEDEFISLDVNDNRSSIKGETVEEMDDDLLEVEKGSRYNKDEFIDNKNKEKGQLQESEKRKGDTIEEKITDIEASDKEKEISDRKEENKFREIKDKITDKISDKATYQVIWMKVKEFVGKVYQWVKKYIWNGILGMGKAGMYIRGANPKRSVRGIIILIVLAVSLLYLSIRGIQKHNENKTNKEDVQELLSEVNEKFENGKSLGEAGDISEAVSILEEAMNRLEGAKDYGFFLDEISNKEEEGMAILDEVRRVVVLTDENIITDIAAYIENVSVNDLSLWKSNLYITDINNASIYEVSTDGGDVNVIISGNTSVKSPSSIVFDSNDNMLINDSDEGIVNLDMNEKSVSKLSGLSVTTVGEIVSLESYTTPDGTDMIYLLRPSENDIRRIIKYPSGYSSPELRIADTKLADSKDIEIDGRIYVLTGSEGIIRYFYDKEDPFTIVGLDKSINSSSCIELDDNYVFFGDNTNKRVVVITKGDYLAPNQGKYVAQVQYRGDGNYLEEIQEIYVDNDGRVMYVLDGTRIFRTDLNKIDEYAETLN